MHPSGCLELTAGLQHPPSLPWKTGLWPTFNLLLFHMCLCVLWSRCHNESYEASLFLTLYLNTKFSSLTGHFLIFCFCGKQIKTFNSWHVTSSHGEGNGTNSSPLAWKIPWMEEPGGLHSMGSLRVRHN